MKSYQLAVFLEWNTPSHILHLTGYSISEQQRLMKEYQNFKLNGGLENGK